MIVLIPPSAATRSYLGNFCRLYPGIIDWYEKVERDIGSGKRSVFAFLDGRGIGGLAITKNGENAKLCHISVAPGLRHVGHGQRLMGLAIAEMLRRGANSITVTTGEEVFRLHGDFFADAGFQLLDRQLHRYRTGVAELIWTMDADRARAHLSHRDPHRGDPRPDLDSTPSPKAPVYSSGSSLP